MPVVIIETLGDLHRELLQRRITALTVLYRPDLNCWIACAAGAGGIVGEHAALTASEAIAEAVFIHPPRDYKDPP